MKKIKLIDHLRMLITPRWYNPVFFLVLIVTVIFSAICGFFMDLFDSIYEWADFYKRNNGAVYDRRSRIWAIKKQRKNGDSGQ